MPVTEQSKTETMRKLSDLQKARATALDQARALQTTADAENRALAAEEQEQFDTLLADADLYEDQYNEALAAAQAAVRKAALAEHEARAAQAPQVRSLLDSGPLARVRGVHDRVMDDPKRGFAHLGDFGLMVAAAAQPGVAMDERLHRIHAAAAGMSQQQGSQGGFAVPPAFSTQIWDGLNTMPDNLMELCDSYPVLGESLTFPANAETSRATGSRYGGVQAYWIAEAGQISTSRPTLREMKLEPQELAALIPVTNKLLRNAPALESYLRKAATEEIMFLVNNSIISGNGAGQPKGILNSGCLITAAAEGGQAADTLVTKNIDNMYRRLHARARPGAIWFYNQEIEAQIDELTFLVGTTGGQPAMAPALNGIASLSEAPIRRLKGLPMRPIEYCSAIGDVGDIILANLSFYALGMQGGIDEAMSIHMFFDTAQTAFRFMFAVDGQTWHQAPLTPFKGTSTLSPFVTLAAR